MVNAAGGLMENPYSWTKAANLLALEAPVGVGFSYCANQVEGKVCQNTDRFTASASRAALVDFFKNKFPEWAERKRVFISGESYAGVYVPTLAKELLDHPSSRDLISLVGLAVGDPCTDNSSQKDSRNKLWYGHKYGLVDDQIFSLLWDKCNVTMGDDEAPSLSLSHSMDFDLMEECSLAYNKFMLSTSAGFASHRWDQNFIDKYSLFAPISGKQELDLQIYLSRKDVRKALHVEEAPIGDTWKRKDPNFDYTKEYDACNQLVSDGALSMIDFYQDIAPRLLVTWVYNGSTDPCLSYEGTRAAIKKVGFAELDGGGYRPWFYNQTAATIDVVGQKAPRFGPNLLLQNMGPQFGGHVTDYEHNLAFLTIHGSGHMAPQFRPQAALHMIRKLVQNHDLTATGEESAMLSPLMPSNKSLQALDWDTFEDVMQEWTKTAMGPPYVTVDETLAVDLNASD